MMDKNDDSGCSIVFAFAGLGFVVFLLYRAVQFLLTPEGIKSVLEFVGGIGICAALAVLMLVAIGVHGRFFYRDPYSKLVSRSRDYRVRCYAVESEKATPGANPPLLSEQSDQSTAYPVYLLFSLTNYGPRLETMSVPATWPCTTAENTRRFGRLSGNRPDPIILTFGFSLYYSLYSQVDNVILVQTPANAAGYTGVLPTLQAGRQVQIVIVYWAILTTENLNQAITLDRPLKLTLVALDDTGQDDPAATHELYNAVLELMQPSTSDDDDSWMYRSRPMSMWY